MTHVIIGNSAAAVGAVEGIRQLDKESPVILITEEPHHTYSRPLISYLLSGKVTAEKMAYRPEDFYVKNHITTMFGRKAAAVDINAKAVILEDGGRVTYGTLLIATGSKPAALKLPGIDSESIFPFYTMKDAFALKQFIRDGMKAVVLGAGLTALKAAEALTTSGVETTLVVRSRILRNFLDPGATEKLSLHLSENGLHLAIGSEPVGITGENNGLSVRLTDGRILACDFVVSAVGIEPNKELIEGVQIATEHGILVDQALRTNVPGIYAAGDVAQGLDLLTGCQRVIPLLPVAYAQGEAAGRNMAGGNAVYAGMNMNAISFFGLPLISAGVIHEEPADEVYLQKSQTGKMYRKLVIRQNRVVGYVLVEQIDRAGLLTWLIREKVNITGFKATLIDGSFNHACLPPKLRREKIAL